MELNEFKGIDPSRHILYKYRNSINKDDSGNIIGINFCGNSLGNKEIQAWLNRSPGFLKSLNLSENRLLQLEIPEGCSKLEYLNISENPDLQFLSLPDSMSRLIRCEVYQTSLVELKIPKGLNSLEYLNARESKIDTIQFQGPLKTLNFLDLSKNQLKEFKLDKDFPALTYLYLNDNQIGMIELPELLPRIKTLHLRNNELQELPSQLLNYPILETLYVYDNPLSSIEKEILPTGEYDNARDNVINYLRSIQGEELIPLREARMILVGNGMVGKTSIRNKLIDENADLPQEPDRTIGLEVDIQPYIIEDLDPGITGLEEPIDFKLNIWDFGGQGKYREVQQLFCGRKTLYIYVTSFDDKPEHQLEREDYVGFEYWLDMVNAYSYDKDEEHWSPIIYVVNKIDEETKLINQEFCHKIFPNIQDFVKISCLKKRNLSLLKDTIRAVLPEISPDIFSSSFSGRWLKLKEELEKARAKHHISWTDYLNISQEVGLNDSEARTWLEILSRIGTVIYFGNNEELRDWVILNPEWVKNSIYRVYNHDPVGRGMMTEANFPKIWPEYSEEEREKIVSLMLAYELCFERENAFGQKEYIIPALLSTDEPRLSEKLKDESNARLRLYFDPFIPAGTVNKMMVRLSNPGMKSYPDPKLMEREKSNMNFGGAISIHNNLYWRNNLILHDSENNTYVWIKENWEAKYIMLDLYGKEVEPLFNFVRSMIEAINKKLTDTKYLSRLSIIPEARVGNTWIKLEDFSVLGQNFFEAIKSGEMEKMKDKIDPKKVFFIYSSKDAVYRDEFEEHFAGLKRKGLVETWYDRKIEPGQDWDTEIKKKLSSADIYLLLLSPGFMNVSYIWETELKIAQQRSKDSRVVPIFLRACDVEDEWFMKKQGAGKDIGWIASIQQRELRDVKWVEVIKELKRVITSPE